ncbi:restriction endonuclease [Desulfitobacterium metallireducens DSM 15288]|uniref:Restriction endonuclease n=1 Tax=Desulfitobacterium metallireducens DSM 15288 TaxID=871968 RepID=W0EAC1_9FIRM|nr:restriction endonuclease [Desulfitobacterium metallireducens DSM 15288]
MNSSELKDRINSLSIWKRGEERAPHKPLLILLALGQLQSRNKQSLYYEEVRELLKELLVEFGPSRKSYHPEQPFVRLANDGIWELNTSVKRDDIKDSWLMKHQVVGGFNDEVYSILNGNDGLIREIAEIVLNNHFPDTIHEDILTSVGLDFDKKVSKFRDPKFRERILNAYEYSCAVCGFNVRLGNNLIAVEAAHIKWHQAGGPDSEENGIALCAMHHKLFDRGVFTITPSRILLVAERAHGTSGFNDWLMQFHGKELRTPIRPEYYPRDTFVEWHVHEVFHGPARYCSG